MIKIDGHGIGHCYGDGYGYGDGIGNGYGDGYGIGIGIGNGDGYGVGTGVGYGNGDGTGSGDGYGIDIGYEHPLIVILLIDTEPLTLAGQSLQLGGFEK